MKRFTQKGAPGAYLRVVEPGEIRSGDPIEIVHRPDHDVTVALQFRAVTTERELLPRLLDAGEALHPESRAMRREVRGGRPALSRGCAGSRAPRAEVVRARADRWGRGAPDHRSGH